MSKKRIDAIRKKMAAENLDGVIVTHLDHVRYLCGYTGTSGMLVLTRNTADFFTDFRYKEQAAKEVKGAKTSIIKGVPTAALKEFPKFNVKNRKYGYNGEYLTVAGLNSLKRDIPGAIFVAADSIFADLGWVKDSEEIANITRAAEIGDIAFGRVLPLLKPGVKESDVAAELEYQMIMLGSQKAAFGTAVASGFRSAWPHASASHKRIKNGDFVTFDFGATVNGYVSDMTRTVLVGKATPKQKKIYNIVLKANKAGIKKVKAGVLGKEVDGVCRKIITKAGYGKEFGHGTGHGIGFFVHVGPRLSPISEDKLMPNNVLTVEPGIYIPGWGGVRIEDDVVVTRTGCRVLTQAPKNLLEL